ncbi:MAG: polysaccharide biosynthesis protein [Bizionia paragorgiae]|uniref:polysaccharide biosynthesis protein n=1 Tax=Bizionia paragorgiae TaxID=283786 RepID=UPI003C318D07
MFKNKCVLITGAAGTIGTALVHHVLAGQPKKIILLDTAETPLYDLEQALNYENNELTAIQYVLGSITNTILVDKLLSENTVDILFHAAAYKHVPIIEKYPLEGVHVNSIGTKQLADSALKFKVKTFVFISTDKAVNPSSVMGATKLLAENYIRSLSKTSSNTTRFVVVRFGNIIDSNGSVIPLFKAQLKQNKALTITHKKASRYFISVSKVVSLVSISLDFARSGEMLLFEMGNAQSIYDIAKTTVENVGLKVEDVSIKTTGLRPGEKLHEELLRSDESIETTVHPEIYVVNSPLKTDLTLLNNVFKQLENAVAIYDTKAAVKTLKTALKTYKSKNSEYSALD